MSNKIFFILSALPVVTISLINKKTLEVEGLSNIEDLIDINEYGFSSEIDEISEYSIVKNGNQEAREPNLKIEVERNEDSTIKTATRYIFLPIHNQLEPEIKAEFTYDDSKRVSEEFIYYNDYVDGLFLAGKSNYVYDDEKNEISITYQSYDQTLDLYKLSTLQILTFNVKEQLISNLFYRYIDEKSKQLEESSFYTYYDTGLVKTQIDKRFSEGVLSSKNVDEYEYDNKNRETLYTRTSYSGNSTDFSSKQKRETVYNGYSSETLVKLYDFEKRDFYVCEKNVLKSTDGKNFEETIYSSIGKSDTFEINSTALIKKEYDSQNRLIFERTESTSYYPEIDTYTNEIVIKYHNFPKDITEEDAEIINKKANRVIVISFSAVLLIFYTYFLMFLIWKHQVKKVIKRGVDKRTLHVFDVIFEPLGSKLYENYRKIFKKGKNNKHNN